MPKGLACELENNQGLPICIAIFQSFAISSAYCKRKHIKSVILLTKVQRVARNIKNNLSIAIICNLLFELFLQIAN